MRVRTYRSPGLRLYTKKDRLIITLLQALFFLALGAVLIYFNVNSYNAAVNQIHKTTGHITNEFESTINHQYNGTWINIDSSKDIYIFNKNTFTPPWDERVTRRQRVDIYYKDGRPLKIVAIQLYDIFGNPLQKFTTPDFTAGQNQAPSAGSIWGIAIGAGLLLIGLFWSIRSIRSYVRSNKSELVRMIY